MVTTVTMVGGVWKRLGFYVDLIDVNTCTFIKLSDVHNRHRL